LDIVCPSKVYILGHLISCVAMWEMMTSLKVGPSGGMFLGH
jgi:hypothetical protein